ncbi:MAG TPA: HAD-IA family hydrolase, partial [Streptosporangiaceae bacterium]|nr:HAD-IA family hydrolase [Streptosporangiaceae bacterium]
LADVTAAPGAAELLARLGAMAGPGSTGLPWAVVTSADTKLAAVRLAAAGLAAPVVITADDVRAGKPDPEGYLLAAARLGVDPGRCLVVEDAAPGVAAGRAAGAMVAGLKDVPADLQIRDLHELAGLLERGPGSARTGGPRRTSPG